MRKFFRQFHYGEKGFTLVELLVVVAILGVLAAVAVPNVGKFIGKGKTESYETELHNIQTGVMAMLADSNSGNLTALGTDADGGGPLAVVDMATVEADSGAISLDEYMTGLGDSPSTAAGETTAAKSGCSYTFASDGTVTQTTTP